MNRENRAVGPGSPQPQAARPNRPAIALAAAVLLVVLANLGFGMTATAATSGAGHDIEAAVAMGSGLVTAGETRHGDPDCRDDQKSAECSSCPSCSGAPPSRAGGDSEVMKIVPAPMFRCHYDDVVPMGIRRPPKLS
jgi:hypothetical protein